MQDYYWNLEELSPNSEEQGISEWDQFDKEHRELDKTLFREAFQNSLDAADGYPAGKIRVRVQWIENVADKGFLKELTEHLGSELTAARREIPTAPPVDALLIEDFGTRGLTGRIDDRTDDGNFTSFFYRHSSSRKEGRAGGRWGLGKLVFARASAWSCWFALTRRADDGRILLMGKAAIGPRTVEGRRYPAFARWASVDERGFELPVEDPAVLERFRRCFGLARRDEPGLSVVVPWPRIPLDATTLRQVVLEEWIVPILRGRLVVEIQGETIDEAAARELAPALLGPAAASFIEGVVATIRPPITLPRVGAYPKEELSEARLDEAGLEAMRATYAAGGIVAARLPVTLFPKGGGAPMSHLDLFLQRGPAGQPGFSLRLRGDITVPDAGRLAAEGVLSAVVATDEAMVEFLADAEPPAHDTWTATTRLRERWKYGPTTVGLIRTAVWKLHSLLAMGAEEAIRDELLDFFWFEDEATPPSAGKGMRARGQKRPAAASPVPAPPPRPRQLELLHRPGGFVLKAGPGLEDTALPCQVRVRMAYVLENADPLKSWSRFDFDLTDEDGDVEVEPEGADILERQGNTLLLLARDRDFRVRVDGFDPKRDLEVRVSHQGNAPR